MSVKDLIIQYFSKTPTEDQEEVFKELEKFLTNTDVSPVFLLTGYAGTGKTSTIASLIKVLKSVNLKPVLISPTGRAAKVMSSYSKRKAFTIHKIIYKLEERDGRFFFRKQKNTSKNTLFIVDEASMIDDQANKFSKGLLEDLTNYVFEKKDSGNKLLIVGDTAQLPPVHQLVSPALSKENLLSKYFPSLFEGFLHQVKRQKNNSGILELATKIRNQITDKRIDLSVLRDKYDQVQIISKNEIEDYINNAYNEFGAENTVIITRSNKAAVDYNQFIRQRVLWSEEKISSGDLIMVVKNNYFWLEAKSPAGFLANGEFAVIKRVINTELKYGFEFADVELELLDFPEQPSFEAKVFLDTLYSNSASLDQNSLDELYCRALKEDNNEKTNKGSIQYAKNPYCNALQVKYAYALTCHKSQGGQWNVVFVDLNFLRWTKPDETFLRWLYTAITRSIDKLYIVC